MITSEPKTTEKATANKPNGSGNRAWADNIAMDDAVINSTLSAQNQNSNITGKLSNIKVKQDELIMFTTQLSVMLDSGVVLSDALDVIAEQLDPLRPFKSVVTDLAESVKGGENFSTALSTYPRIFGPMFISMVKASEASGKMVKMLRVLGGYLEFEVETHKRIKGALAYPFIMALMAVAATGTMMFFVLPRFMNIYDAKGAALPKITQLLVSFSKILGNFQLMTTIITIAIFTVISLYYFAKTLTGQKVIDYLKIRTPVLGTMFIDMVITRSMRIMSTMINTGVSLLDTVQIIQGSCQNYYFHQLWSMTDDKIRDGYQLSESIQLAKHGDLIDPSIVQMLKAGEKSGKIGEVSDKISTYYEKKLEISIKSVISLIEPLMITVLGIVIGTIAIALLLPVFKISTVISQ